MKTAAAPMEVGTRVRNIKTRVVGTIESIAADDITVKIENEEGLVSKAVCREKDLEVLNVAEYELVKKLKEARSRRAEANKAAEEAKSAAATAEDELIEYLRTHDLQSTAAYEGAGKVEIDGMKVMPSITEENLPAAYEQIRAIGRGEIIKETIHSSTLASFVTELIDAGTPVPDKIGYFLKPKLSLTKK